jgi:hypothetical protein
MWGSGSILICVELGASLLDRFDCTLTVATTVSGIALDAPLVTARRSCSRLEGGKQPNGDWSHTRQRRIRSPKGRCRNV